MNGTNEDKLINELNAINGRQAAGTAKPTDARRRTEIAGQLKKIKRDSGGTDRRVPMGLQTR